jgi:predicted PurR-regulated permease PerM
MITFTLGALAALAVGVIVWLVVLFYSINKQVKHLEEQIRGLWVNSERLHDSLNGNLANNIRDLQDDITECNRYTDSRVDKLVNYMEDKFVLKKYNTDNTIDYNN